MKKGLELEGFNVQRNFKNPRGWDIQLFFKYAGCDIAIENENLVTNLNPVQAKEIVDELLEILNFTLYACRALNDGYVTFIEEFGDIEYLEQYVRNLETFPFKFKRKIPPCFNDVGLVNLANKTFDSVKDTLNMKEESGFNGYAN